MQLIARHGDVDLFRLEEAPKSKAKKVKKLVLALGEVTGHKHVITAEKDEDILVYEWDNELGVVFRLNAPAKLSHEEHATITLPPGLYTKSIEREYDPFQNIERQVID
jgi:hypothetical protein